MLNRIEAAEVRPQFRIWIRFANGVQGEVDLTDLVGKGVFGALTDPTQFARAYVDQESGTVAWPGGLDLAPDALYHELSGVRTR